MDETEIRQIIDRELNIIQLIIETAIEDVGIGKEVIYQEIKKEMRMREIQEERNGLKNNNSKPTSKQLNYARMLGIENPESYGKSELSAKIDEYKERRRF